MIDRTKNQEPRAKNQDFKERGVSPIAKFGIAIIFAVIGIFGAFKLIVGDSTTIAGGLITTVALCGLLIIYFSDAVDWFDLKNLKVQMRKVEDARLEIEQKEAEISRIALATAEIAIFFAAFHRRLGSTRTRELENRWLENRLGQLLSDSSIDYSERNNAFRWLREVKAMDTIENDEERKKKWERIWDRVEAEMKAIK